MMERNMKYTYFIMLISLCGAINAQNRSPWKAPPTAANIANPIPNTPDNVAEGKKIYINTCSPCHGIKGKGDGPAAIAFTPRPADHTSQNVQSQTDGALYWKITNGHGQMISYKNVLKDDQRWKVVLYIRTLKRTK